jgi:hypothetical protein
VFASLDTLMRLGEMSSKVCKVPEEGSDRRGQRSRLARLLSRISGSD